VPSFRSRAKKEGALFSRVSSEALEKPCVTHERDMHPNRYILHFAWHTRKIFQVSDVPTDASNATILELSADMIPHSGAFVRQNFIFSAVSPLEPCHLSHEAQGKSCLYSMLPERGDISRGSLGKCCQCGSVASCQCCLCPIGRCRDKRDRGCSRQGQQEGKNVCKTKALTRRWQCRKATPHGSAS
jgi:hypothetical protein